MPPCAGAAVALARIGGVGRSGALRRTAAIDANVVRASDRVSRRTPAGLRRQGGSTRPAASAAGARERSANPGRCQLPLRLDLLHGARRAGWHDSVRRRTSLANPAFGASYNARHPWSDPSTRCALRPTRQQAKPRHAFLALSGRQPVRADRELHFVSHPHTPADNHEYGILGYFDTWLVALLAVVKLGGQHSIIRFYPHGQPTQLRAFVSSFLLVPFRYAFVLWLVLMAGYYLRQPRHAGRSPRRRLVHDRADPALCMDQLRQCADRHRGALVAVHGSHHRAALGGNAGDRSHRAVPAPPTPPAPMPRAWWWRAQSRCGWRAGCSATTRRAGATRCARIGWRRCRTRCRWSPTRSRARCCRLLDRVMLKEVLDDFVPVGIFAVGAGLAATLNSDRQPGAVGGVPQVSMRQYALEGAAAVVKTKRDTPAHDGVRVHHADGRRAVRRPRFPAGAVGSRQDWPRRRCSSRSACAISAMASST